MLKKLVAAVLVFFFGMGLAVAQVDVNKADQAALDGIRGIGPAMSKRILDERKKGEFRDWADFESRVKGVGDKSADKLSGAGLTVNGQARGKTVTSAKENVRGFTKKTKEQDAKADQAAGTKG